MSISMLTGSELIDAKLKSNFFSGRQKIEIIFNHPASKLTIKPFRNVPLRFYIFFDSTSAQIQLPAPIKFESDGLHIYESLWEESASLENYHFNLIKSLRVKKIEKAGGLSDFSNFLSFSNRSTPLFSSNRVDGLEKGAIDKLNIEGVINLKKPLFLYEAQQQLKGKQNILLSFFANRSLGQVDSGIMLEYN